MSVSYIQKRKHAGKRFFEDLGNGQQLEMVLIPGGRFTMGSPDDEEGREDNEGPQHDVTVPTFFMGRYPVTQAQWRQVSRFKPVNPDIQFPRNPSKFSGKKNSDQRPVEQVTWHQAKEFCDRLSVHTNQTIVCHQKQNGNMLAVREPQRLSLLVKQLALKSLTMTETTFTVQVKKANIEGKRLP